MTIFCNSLLLHMHVIIFFICFVFCFSYNTEIPHSKGLNKLKIKVEESILAELNKDFGWHHERTPFAVSALALSNAKVFRCHNSTGALIKKELQLELAKHLLRKKKDPLSPGQLAMYINALVSTCQDPHDFSGINLISMIRHKDPSHGYEEALKLLALCNAGHRLSKESMSNLTTLFKPESQSIHNGLDTQAMSALALVCSSRDNQNTYVYNTLKDIVELFEHFQKSDGSFGNIYTTALVAQVLTAIKGHRQDEGWSLRKVQKNIKKYHENETFNHSIMSNFFVLPVLNSKSLADIKYIQCDCKKNDMRDDISENDIWRFVDGDYVEVPATQEEIEKQSDVVPKISVTYSLRSTIENSNLKINISTVVFIDDGETLAHVMEKAAKADERFLYVVQNTTYGPIVSSIAGLENDLSMRNFWILYKLRDGNQILLDEGISTIVPEDGEHFVFIYEKSST